MIDCREGDDTRKRMGAFDSGEISIPVEISKESAKSLKKLFEVDDNIIKEMLDIYNYMAKKNSKRMGICFHDGLKFIATIDDSEFEGRKENENSYTENPS